jgi:nitrogen-specific signal transduction histidine kinase
MTLIVTLMCLAIVAVVVLQGNWLLNSYAVSREKNQADVQALLDAAINMQKKEAADSVRMLMLRVIRTKSDFQYRVFERPTGTKIGFRSGENGSYAMYPASPADLLLLERDPYQLLQRKMSALQLDELYPLFLMLIGVNTYPDNSVERNLQLRLGPHFHPYKDTVALRKVLDRVFEEDGRAFDGRVRVCSDISEIYTKKATNQLRQRQPSISPGETIGIAFGSDNSRSLATKLDRMNFHIDSLNRLGDSVFVAKPLLYDINDMLRDQVPVVVLAVKTPVTYIGRKMLAGIAGSGTLMLFIALCVVYMYVTILKQKELSELKNDFISNISHELKTPIATAQAAVQGLSFFDTREDSEKADRYLQTASAEIRRLASMVERILNISRFESPSFEINPDHFNLKEMLLRLMEAHQVGNDKPVSISLEYQAREEVFADGPQFYNVMANLVDNAVKYSGASVHIHIACWESDRGIMLSISDDGSGIPPQYRQHVFDKFFRVPNGRNHSVKGYGLGLNYVKTIVEKHGGSVRVGDSGKSGSTFVINLPNA